MTESILVTGANGLVGRATLACLASARRVIALVRERPRQPFPDGVETIVQDLRGRSDPELSVAPETIIHLAQSPCYREFPKGALDVFEVNAGATQRLLDWAQRRGVKRFIYASSGGVYGTGDSAFVEDRPIDSSCADVEHYIASKRCGELITKSYSDRMIVIVLRFFFVYGPGQDANMLIPRLVASVVDDRAILLQGRDGIRINPIYVDDAAGAVAAAAGLEASELINVAGPEVLSLREIGNLIGEATGRTPRFEVQSDTAPGNLVGSTNKMIRLLGAPKTCIAEGLNKIVTANHALGDKRHAN